MATNLERMLFDYVTTSRTDYRNGHILEPVSTVYQPKSKCYRIRPPPLRDVHTLSDWKAAAIPFDLLHRPKDITGTNPTKLQEPYANPVDLGREAAQKCRPRLVMTPAVSMDDVDDVRARSVLCSDMYVSATTRAQRDVAPRSANVTAPLPALPAPANPVVLSKLQAPVVSPEWRMQTAAWDGRQLRAHCDPTKSFWLKLELPRCRACEESAAVVQHRTAQRQAYRR